MRQKIKDLDIVAIMEDIKTTHFKMEFDGTAFEVEFANNDSKI